MPQIADKLWSISSRHFIYRLVLELEDLEELPSGMMGQLVMLQERLAQCGGALRICGLSPECEETLHSCHLDSALPNHASREAAVMGERVRRRIESVAALELQSRLRCIVDVDSRAAHERRLHLLSAVEILLADLAQRFEGRLGFVGGVEYAAVRVVVRRGVGELVPQHDLHRVLRQQQRHVLVDPVALRFGRYFVLVRC